MDYESGAIERPQELEKNPQGVVKRWMLELKLAEKRESEWRKKGERVWDTYRQKSRRAHSFNILWSNTETLRPAVYNSLPSPDVRRRFKDDDSIGKAVAEVLSRSIEYQLDTTPFDEQIKASVLDLLLPGRGVCRVRYVPSLAQVGVTAETHIEENEQHAEGGESSEGDTEEVAWEQAPIEHVQWDDFRISAGKEWSEICWVAFGHKLTRDELCEKFGDEIGKAVQLDNVDDEDVKAEREDSVQEAFKTARVWEIWDKDNRKVHFVSAGYKESPLQTLDDPLTLKDFFPIPCPLYAVEDSSSLVPVPLFEQYREQAEELNTISKRINILVKGLKMRGIYDSTLSELSELMRGEDNDLIPAQNVTALLERGGLEKAIWFMPIEQAAKVLQILYEQREATKQTIYEITGISDILRGSTKATETATAQQIKANWGSNRLKRLQAEVSRFVRDLIRLQAEIIGERFQADTLAAMTGLKFPTGEEKQQQMMQFQQQAMMAQQQGQQPQPMPQMPPSWDEIVQVLRDDKFRTFKVDVETDSTVAASQEADMQALRELLGGLSELLQGFGPAVQMGAMPVEALKEIMLSVVRRARLGNAVEDAFDKMKAPPPPQQEQDQSPQVEQMKQQGEMQRMQMEQQHASQIEIAKAQYQRECDQMKADVEKYKADMQAANERERIAFDRWKVEMDASTKLAVAQIGAETSLKTSAISASTDEIEVGDDGVRKPAAGLQAVVDSMNANLINLIESQSVGQEKLLTRLTETLSRPKKLIRGPDGRAMGVQ